MKYLIAFLLFLSVQAHAQTNTGFGFRVGVGIGFADLNQEIPSTGADLDSHAMEVSLFHFSYQGVITQGFLMALNGSFGRALFNPDGALLIPDDDVTVYDANWEGRWQWGQGSWTSPRSFSPFWILGVNIAGLPVFKIPGASGALYELDRMDIWSAVAGVGTGIYFSNSSLQGSVRLLYPFLSNSDYDISTGYGYIIQLSYDFTMGKLGSVGLGLYDKYQAADFDAENRQTQTRVENDYTLHSYGIKAFYTYTFGKEQR